MSASTSRARRQGKTLVLTIADKESDAYLGEILLFFRQWQVAELAYLVLPSARGRGLATKAVRLMGTWAFDRLGVQRLQLMVAVENKSSHRVAEKNGIGGGVLRSAYEVQGARADMVMSRDFQVTRRWLSDVCRSLRRQVAASSGPCWLLRETFPHTGAASWYVPGPLDL